MQVAFLTPHFAPQFEGGTELVARAQAAALALRGHAVRVLSGTDEPHAGADLERGTGDLEVTFLPRHPDETYDLELERPRVAALVAAEVQTADLVHLHHWSTLTGSLVRDLVPARPVVVTLHDLFVTCPRFFRVPVAPVVTCPTGRSDDGSDLQVCARCIAVDAPGIGAEQLVLGLRERFDAFQAELLAASLIIVPSRSHLENLRRFVELPGATTSVVHHGLCAPVTRGTRGTRAGALTPPRAFSPDEPLRILFLGHRSPVKGVTDLVDALAGLEPEQRACVHLILLGMEVQAGFDDELRERAGDLSLQVGEAYQVEDLGSLLMAAGGAHLAALPSRVCESYGLVVDEALDLGLPVWVSSHGAPKERVGGSGKVLPPADPETWRKALVEVLEAPDTLVSDRADPRAPSRTAHDAARDLEELYLGLVAGR